ncbi:Inherit from COG: Catalyzes the S-adenosylmethionine monomethyl esterification of trans-aconitate (By similarity) [Seminavis robusta]|uniref:Inherit from COG: Catalyzes the S-adenosylmethionine monomethyl esterification of trans-aconitate By similarity n=1 Tax=Seminavis robusta TaxID=568900 RepID=A0A9N8E2C1_9STRA|nr:Inherit from COG: Catalyzes the S-adenosylmethionine monomethyl esterification of trans-aconitate (By similarity) [Seminavis robusta]|eukprot:Sro579_g169980.1 Inherit from COG: Catalyzes the S-adenosylmethionine monomethyl esterification of trans-aconitate (By similarity) (149) ;mRNA; f:29998-30444
MTLFCCSGRADYMNHWLNNHGTKLIKEFIAFTNGETLPECNEQFAIQAVTKQDFGPVLSTIWYVREGTGFRIDDTSNSDRRFQRSNDFKNFKCRSHKRFFEVNLYTKDGVSHHHESTRSGRSYARDASIDQDSGICTKGAHWTHPAQK